MDTRGNTEFARRERYSAAFNRAAEAIVRQLRHDPRRFVEFIDGDVSLNRAFKTPDELSKEIGYSFRKEYIDAAALAATNAALALHQVWKDFHDKKAQTAQELAIARYLDGLVQAEVDEKAEQEAENELESAA